MKALSNAYYARKGREHRARKKAQGICIQHGCAQSSIKNQTRCEYHRDLIRRQCQARAAARKKMGRCKECNEPVKSKTLCSTHLEKLKAYARNKRQITTKQKREAEMAKKHTMDWNGQDLELKEAKKSLSVLVNEQNIKSAKRADAQACAIAQAICSVVGNEAKIFRTAAYIRRGDTVYRYVMSKPDRDAVVHFDKTGEFPTGPITLLAPTPSTTLKAKRAQTALNRKRKGTYRTRRSQPRPVKVDGVRLGIGKVHVS